MSSRTFLTASFAILALGVLGTVAYLEFKRPEKAAPTPAPAVRAPEESLPGVRQEEPQPGAKTQPQEEKLPDDPRFKASSIDEPEMPVKTEDAKKAGYSTMKDGGYIFERKDKSGKTIQGVVVPGIVLLNRGLIELFGCGEGGKTHESVLRVDCDIQSLDGALVLADFKRGRIPETLGKPDAAAGARVVILVQWKNDEGKVVTYRAEDLVIHAKRESLMPRVGWTYVGNWAEVEDPTSTAQDRKTYKILAASSSQSVMTTWRDGSSLFDNPLPDAVDDTLYAANWMVLPAPGTKVSIIIRAPNSEEAKEVAAVEEALSK